MEANDDATFYKPKGCSHCRNTGYRGRIGIFEVLNIDENLQSLIASGASETDLLAAAVAGGNFMTMREDVALKAQRGDTSLDEAAAKVVL